jgi:hypothetical protein
MALKPRLMDYDAAHRESVKILNLRGRLACLLNSQARAKALDACDIIHAILCDLRDGKVG